MCVRVCWRGGREEVLRNTHMTRKINSMIADAAASCIKLL